MIGCLLHLPSCRHYLHKTIHMHVEMRLYIAEIGALNKQYNQCIMTRITSSLDLDPEYN